MAEKSTDAPVRIIGSRELHQNLPGILRELENDEVRYVLTVHGKPRAVLFRDDGLHMAPAGYAIWLRALRPVLARYGFATH